MTLSKRVAARLVRIDDSEFDTVLACETPEPFCAPGYLRALSKSTQVVPVVATATGEGWHGSFVLMLRQIDSGWTARTPDFGGPVFFGDGGHAGEMRSAIDELLKQEGVISEVTLFSPWRDDSTDILAAWAASPEKVVQLLQITDLEGILSGMSSGRRYDLRKAERDLKVIVKDFDPDSASQFSDRYVTMMERYGAQERFRLSNSYFTSLATEAGESFILAEATDGDSGASVLYLYDRYRAAYLHSVRWGASTGATTICNWRAFESLADLGVEEVNLGGGLTTDLSDPLLAFKQSFGGRAGTLHLAARVYDPDGHERAVSSGTARPLPKCTVRA
jgi:Acetyltransferase (GNAT) domain